MSEGYIYILENPNMHDIVKVGKTTGSVVERAGQLSSSTGVPSAFQIVKSYHCNDCDLAERYAHEILTHAVGRPNDRREFFSTSSSTAIGILDIALEPFLFRMKADLPNLLVSAINRTLKKEFTLAAQEFEIAFESEIEMTWMNFLLNEKLLKAAGAYLACCCSVARPLRYSYVLMNAKIKGTITQHAIDLMQTWNDDAASELIAFTRHSS